MSANWCRDCSAPLPWSVKGQKPIRCFSCAKRHAEVTPGRQAVADVVNALWFKTWLSEPADVPGIAGNPLHVSRDAVPRVFFVASGSYGWPGTLHEYRCGMTTCGIAVVGALMFMHGPPVEGFDRDRAAFASGLPSMRGARWCVVCRPVD